jgi:MraZ protein
MFAGTFYYTLETKGRVSVPALFRKQLGKKPVLTRGLDGSLFLYEQEAWMKLITELQDTTVLKKAHRDTVRLFLNEAIELEIDAQGRIHLPAHLCDKVGLKKTVVFAGSLDHVELWDSVRYASYMDALEKNAESVVEEISVPARKVGLHE